MTFIAGILLILSALMSRAFMIEYRKAGGMPWAAEFPLGIILILAGSGVMILSKTLFGY